MDMADYITQDRNQAWEYEKECYKLKKQQKDGLKAGTPKDLLALRREHILRPVVMWLHRAAHRHRIALPNCHVHDVQGVIDNLKEFKKHLEDQTELLNEDFTLKAVNRYLVNALTSKSM